jgi:hypothetical protein
MERKYSSFHQQDLHQIKGVKYLRAQSPLKNQRTKGEYKANGIIV